MTTPAKGPPSRWPLLFAALSAIAMAALWVVGAFTIPSPVLLGVLLGLTVLTGLLSLCGRRNMTTLLGLGAIVAVVAFALLVLANGDGPLTPVNEGTAAVGLPQRLRLVDFNVLHGYPEFHNHEARFEDTTAALRALDPDILVLQEAWSTTEHGSMAERLAGSLGLHHVYARANGSRRLIGFEEGSAILSRFPIREANRLLLSPRRPPWENRIALVATLDLGSQSMTVVGVHLAAGSEEVAEGQASSLLARIPSGGFVLVAGDLNAGSESPTVRRFLDAGFVDLMPGGIDHVLPRDLASTGWRVERVAWTLRPDDVVELIGKETELSDHLAIVLDLVRE